MASVSKPTNSKVVKVYLVLCVEKKRQKKRQEVIGDLEDTTSSFLEHLEITYGLKDIERLSFHGTNLDPKCTLESHNVHNGDELTVYTKKQIKSLYDHHVIVDVYASDSSKKTVRQHICGSTTLEQLKHLLQNRTRIPVGQQVLLYNGKPVPPGKLDSRLIVGTSNRPFVLKQQPKHRPFKDVEPDGPFSKTEEAVNQLPDSYITPCTQLMGVAKRMVKWKPEAHLLGLTLAEIETICQNFHDDHEEQKYQMLVKWWKTLGRRATWRALASALRKQPQNIVHVAETLAELKQPRNEDIQDVPAPTHLTPQPSTSVLTEEAPSSRRGSAVNEEEIAAPISRRLTPEELCEEIQALPEALKYQWFSTSAKLGIHRQECIAIRNESKDLKQRLLSFCKVWLRQDPYASAEKFKEATQQR